MFTSQFVLLTSSLSLIHLSVTKEGSANTSRGDSPYMAPPTSNSPPPPWEPPANPWHDPLPPAYPADTGDTCTHAAKPKINRESRIDISNNIFKLNCILVYLSSPQQLIHSQHSQGVSGNLLPDLEAPQVNNTFFLLLSLCISHTCNVTTHSFPAFRWGSV